MSRTTRRVSSEAEEAETDVTEVAASPDTGSVWWAELLLGTACLVAAVGFALAATAIGPFSGITVVYGRLLAGAYLAVAVGLGLQFLRSGVRTMPGSIGGGAASSDGTSEGSVAPGNESDAEPQ